jgi:hypothetical protein
MVRQGLYLNVGTALGAAGPKMTSSFGRRPLDELIATDESAWPEVREWIRQATNRVEVLPVDERARGPALLKVQVTTRSPMGAIVFETGGVLVDGGWLRIFGSGHPRLTRTLPDWNLGRTWLDESSPPPCLLIADDVLGGQFAVNGGVFAGKPGSVFYLAPDTLDWEDLEMGYSDFVWWTFSGDLAKFYETWRWPNWRDEVGALTGDEAFSIYPFLWAQGPTIAERARRAVPASELYTLQLDVREQPSRAPES